MTLQPDIQKQDTQPPPRTMEQEMRTIGFVGTGAISEAIIRGLFAEPPLDYEVIVSPRNAETAARLEAEFTQVRVASDNQEVVNLADTVLLAVRPQVAEGIIRNLQFSSGQTVISFVAATDRKRLMDWIAADVRLVQAMPLPFVAERQGITTVYPPDDRVADLFSELGIAIECESVSEFNRLTASGCLMATYFEFLGRSIEWLADQGVSRQKSRAYMASLFARLSNRALRSGSTGMKELSREFATKGGLNEQVLADFEHNGGFDALTAALDRVLARIEQ